jgi:hypothetical protein
MTQDYPYMMSNNKIGPIFQKIMTAAKPQKFTHDFLKKLGFSSTNDRAIIPLLKKLHFLNDDGSPTEYYSRLKDKNDLPYVLGERVKDLYSDLFSINTDIHNASDDEIKGAISRVTGQDETQTNRFFLTFKALLAIAKFGEAPQKGEKKKDEVVKVDIETQKQKKEDHKPSFHYDIQIHLPATTDVSVYNAIFKSLKDNLLI